MTRKTADWQTIRPEVAHAIHDMLWDGMDPDVLIQRLASIVRGQAMVLSEERRAETVKKRASDEEE